MRKGSVVTMDTINSKYPFMRELHGKEGLLEESVNGCVQVYHYGALVHLKKDDNCFVVDSEVV